jgi:hypothetical protein
MTTAIPLFFKPVSYQDVSYCDGGFREGYPRGYCPSEEYLGIAIKGGCNYNTKGTIGEFPILRTIYALITGTEQTNNTRDDPRVLTLEVNLGLNFDVDDETKQRIVREAYKKTSEYIQSTIHK